MNKNNKIYFNTDITLSAVYAKRENVLETGISFKGDAKINDNLYIVTDKEIKIDGDIENTHKTYLKVMEMRDLTEEEQKYANKFRELLGKMFEIMFYNKNLMIAWSILISTALGINIANGNFLGAVLQSLCLLIVNRPIKFIKEIIKMFKRDAKLEELTEFLREQHVLGYVDSVDDKSDIKMYAKLR